jgi:hypothetical protein
MMLPLGPWMNPDGTPTDAFRTFCQALSTAQGGPAYEIIIRRVDDETIKFRMRGADGTWRESATVALT